MTNLAHNKLWTVGFSCRSELDWMQEEHVTGTLCLDTLPSSSCLRGSIFASLFWILYLLGPMSLLQAISLNGRLRLVYPRAQPGTLVVVQESDLRNFDSSLLKGPSKCILTCLS
jgi:hypothetical protein